jgi:hypothetical protein
LWYYGAAVAAANVLVIFFNFHYISTSCVCIIISSIIITCCTAVQVYYFSPTASFDYKCYNITINYIILYRRDFSRHGNRNHIIITRSDSILGWKFVFSDGYYPFTRHGVVNACEFFFKNSQYFDGLCNYLKCTDARELCIKIKLRC